MKALVATGQPKIPLEFREVPEPEPNATSALIEVARVSLNRGELHRLAVAKEGWRPGWDIAGTVIADSMQGSGLKVGDRVVALAEGGSWAERVSVPTANLAVLPSSVSLGAACTLPTAGITALRTLQRGGHLLGKNVLITGSTGGVGAFAVSLAHLSGANVTAVAARENNYEKLFNNRDIKIVQRIKDAQVGGYDLVLESVGGDSLRYAIGAVSAGGVVVTFGNSSKQRTDFLVNDFYIQDRAKIEAYFLFGDIKSNPVHRDLAILASLVAEERLNPVFGAEAPWTDWAGVLNSLADRSLDGKAVLTVSAAV